MQQKTKGIDINPAAVGRGVVAVAVILGGIAVPAIMLVANLAIRGFGPVKPKVALLLLLPMALIGGTFFMMRRAAKRAAPQKPARRPQEAVKVPPALLAFRSDHARP